MKLERFNHDYNHCLGIDCKQREDCANYLAYIEAKEMDLKNIKTVAHCKDIEMEYTKVTIGKKIAKNSP